MASRPEHLVGTRKIRGHRLTREAGYENNKPFNMRLREEPFETKSPYCFNRWTSLRAVLLRRAGMTLALFLVAGSADTICHFRNSNWIDDARRWIDFGIAPAIGRNIPC
jgi:hypothetical protein